MAAILNEQRVLLLPATRRDGEVMSELLKRAKLAFILCTNAGDMATRIGEAVGVLLLTDAVFQDPDVEQILAVLKRQEPWSDVPSVLLCRAGHQSSIAEQVTQSLDNVTVLDRPTPMRTLLSALKAALRARRRQYQMREQFTALQTSELALKAASESLYDADRRKDEFLAMLAHELRNPLAPLQNGIEVLSRRSTDEQLLKIVSLLKRQAGQLSRLVDDLLDMSRITNGRIELRLAPVKIEGVIVQACESVEPLLQEKQHSLAIESDKAAALYVRGDYARLVQSVANLLTNAVKYTDSGGEIRVAVRAEKNQAVITVSDNGVGIAPELLPHIFDLFVQGQRSLDRSQGGLGIGLSVVKRLVDMHGGRIAAHSDGVGRGSSFTLSLPLIAAPVTSVVAPSAVITAKHILIVDDNEDAANSLAEILQMDGHTVEVVYTGSDAVTRALASKPDVILLDVGLPDMSGYEVASRIRGVLASTQLIALTGYGQPDDLRRAREAGFDAHAIKPVDLAALATLIAEFGLPKSQGTDRLSINLLA